MALASGCHASAIGYALEYEAKGWGFETARALNFFFMLFIIVVVVVLFVFLIFLFFPFLFSQK